MHSGFGIGLGVERQRRVVLGVALAVGILSVLLLQAGRVVADDVPDPGSDALFVTGKVGFFCQGRYTIGSIKAAADPNDFDVVTQDSVLKLWDQISQATFLALVVAAFSFTALAASNVRTRSPSSRSR